MEELIVLGTGNATVTKCFNTCFAFRKEKEYFLVDTGGGNGILSRLEEANIPITSIHNIFISHEHTDHLLGVVWLIRVIGTKMNQGQYDGNLYIYCHEELVNTIKTIVRLTVQQKFYRFFDERMIFVPLKDGDKHTIVETEVTFFDIHSTKAKQFAFSLELESGNKLTFCGDEPYSEAIHSYVEGSVYLLHEAFCRYEDQEIFKPYEKHHSTVKDACQLATRLGVTNLILWHTEDKNLKERKEQYTNEGKQYFSGNLYVPYDLEVLPLV